MIINTQTDYSFFQIVYLITDMEQLPRMVIGIKLCPGNDILIELQTGTIVSWHYPGEISKEKNQLTTLGV